MKYLSLVLSAAIVLLNLGCASSHGEPVAHVREVTSAELSSAISSGQLISGTIRVRGYVYLGRLAQIPMSLGDITSDSSRKIPEGDDCVQLVFQQLPRSRSGLYIIEGELRDVSKSYAERSLGFDVNGNLVVPCCYPNAYAFLFVTKFTKAPLN